MNDPEMILKQQFLKIISIYRPSRIPFHQLLGAINEVLDDTSDGDKLIIGGDFNVDVSTGDEQTVQLTSLMASKHGLEQIIHGPTTDYGSTIDLIFTNLDKENHLAGVLENWYSDHKPIWIAVNDDFC